MKRLAICCDGTWNRLDARHPTNVVRLAEAILPTADDGTTQLVYYDEGVGARSTAHFSLLNRIDRVFSGAFGWGLLDHLEQAYRFLVFNYEPGDEIYIFGFSRGAFTARSLAGLIRNCGIVMQDRAHRLHEAVRLYQSRDPADHPDSENARKFRMEYAPHIYLNQEELDWRIRQGMTDNPESIGLLRMRYIGVWDTVGALGVPNRFWLLSRFLNRKYQFHDTNLSSTVQGARHAVGLDERRRDFEPALWSNLDRLNCNTEEGEALPFQQLWFPGDHSSIGGGGKVEGLAQAALGWIAEGAEDAKLGFHQAALYEYSQAADYLADVLSSGRERRFYQKRARKGPTRIEDVAPITIQRWRDADPPYRPKSLNRLKGALDQEARRKVKPAETDGDGDDSDR